MQPLILAAGDEGIAMIAIGGGLLVAIVAIITGTLRCIHKTRAREQTKREIAAYIAEGSMTPEDGERLLRADDFEQSRREIAAHVAEGSITLGDGERLIAAGNPKDRR